MAQDADVAFAFSLDTPPSTTRCSPLRARLLAESAGQSRIEPLPRWTGLHVSDLARLTGRPTVGHQNACSRAVGEAVDSRMGLCCKLSSGGGPRWCGAPTSVMLAVDRETLCGTFPLDHIRCVHLGAAHLHEDAVRSSPVRYFTPRKAVPGYDTDTRIGPCTVIVRGCTPSGSCRQRVGRDS